MNVLFLCYANIGRSQIAESFFHLHSSRHRASSAGLKDGILNGTSLHPLIYQTMEPLGLYLRNHTQKQVTPEMIEKSRLVISLADEEQLQTQSERARLEPAREKLVFWPVTDPKGKDLEFHCRVRDEIHDYVQHLVEELDIVYLPPDTNV